MKIEDTLRKTGVTVPTDCTFREAAALMEENAVGALVVLDGTTPVGIVTDRDLVCRVLARGLSGDGRVDSVMSSPVETVEAGSDLETVMGMFESRAVRRLVVTRDGTFVGVTSADDFLIDLASQLSAVVRPITAETLFGHHDSPLPVSS